MSSLVGHLLIGVIFLVYGGWWIFASIWLNIREKFNLTRRVKDINIDHKSFIPFFCAPRWPIEPILKIILPAFAVCASIFFTGDADGHFKPEVWHIYNEHHKFNKMVSLHHMTMYSCFLLSGVIDLLSLCGRYLKHVPQIFFALAFLVESMVFYFHITIDNDRGPLERLTHTLLIYSIVACLVFALLRLWQTTNIIINAGLAVSLTLQGTWFIEIGTVLKWNGTTNENMFLVATFIWHFMLILVVFVLLYSAVHLGVKYYIKRRTQQLPHYHEEVDDTKVTLIDEEI